jgi:hypothetical protein
MQFVSPILLRWHPHILEQEGHEINFCVPDELRELHYKYRHAQRTRVNEKEKAKTKSFAVERTQVPTQKIETRLS